MTRRLAVANLAINYIISFSTRPLRLATYLGLAASLFSILMGVFYTAQQLIFGITVSGWPTIIVTLSMLGGMILFVLGIIGEYLGKMHIELQNRQLYVVDSTMNMEDTSHVASRPHHDSSLRQ